MTTRTYVFNRFTSGDIYKASIYIPKSGNVVVMEDTTLDVVLEENIINQTFNISCSTSTWGVNITTNVYVNNELKTSVITPDAGQGNYAHTVSVPITPNTSSLESATFSYLEQNYGSKPFDNLPIVLTGEDVDLWFSWGGCCVPHNAPIKLSNGVYKEASSVVEGDIIYGYDILTNEIVETKVLKVSKPIRDHIIEIGLSDNTTMKVTKNHSVLTNEGWAAYCPQEVTEVDNAIELSIGQKLINENNEWVEIVSIKYVPYEDGLQCIDLTTTTENYFASGYLVHNAGCPGEDQTLDLFITSN